MDHSIVMPLYNKEKHVLSAVKSVLGQSFYPEFELIIVDDGSTDGSLDALNTLKDSRINIIHKENGGVSSARNKGIQAAKGRYISFLDADDEMHKRYLNTVQDLISTYPKAGFYSVPVYLKKKKRSVMVAPAQDRGLWNYLDFVLAGGQVSASSVTIKKEVFSDVGLFRTNCPMAEDMDMWFRIGLHYPLGYSSSIYNTYNFATEDGATKRLPPPVSSPLIASYLESRPSLSEISRAKIQKYLVTVRNDDILRFLYLGQKKEALQVLAECRRLFRSKKKTWTIIPYIPQFFSRPLYYLLRLLDHIDG